ncbi:MAG: ABC transporter ATP-binding protein [Spirochaetes bacterium]|nr:ABC transporter ATP-binding protein [Spirochaetota bacterium]
MSELRMENLVARYGKVTALDRLNLTIKDGELVTLLGPSGCGKTTTLRSVSGFLKPDEGNIYIGHRNITDIPPEKRGIGLVFQNYALWPHMTVFQNLAFGLELRKVPLEEIRKKVRSVLSIVKLEGYEDRYPRQLSGGQQQRVALARAIILEPDILLLDEPLSNLDALLREQMRFEIAQIHKRLGITTLYVTHDQTEAMVISDRIVIMKDGKVMQDGRPEEIYLRPTNRFVAGFMGTTTFLEGTVQTIQGDSCMLKTFEGWELRGIACGGVTPGTKASAAVRPEAVEVLYSPIGAVSGKTPAENSFEAEVDSSYFTGEVIDYHFRLGSSFIRVRGDTKRILKPGDKVTVRIDPDRLPIVPAESI